MARKLLRAVFALAIVLIAVALAKILIDGWDEVLASYRSIDYRYLAASFLAGQLNVICLMLLWWCLLKQVSGGKGLTLLAAAQIFASAWLGRYLPGRIWTAAGKVYLGSKQGCDLRHLSISVFFELALSITAQAMVALIMVMLFFDGIVFGSWVGIVLALLAVAVIMLTIHPVIFCKLVNVVIKRLDKRPIDSKEALPYPVILLFLLLYGLQVLIMATCLLLFARALAPLDGETAVFVLASFIVANFVGRLVFIAPVGLGVREGALTALLQFKLSLALATLITVLSRVWLVLIDLSFVALVVIAKRLGRAS